MSNLGSGRSLCKGLLSQTHSRDNGAGSHMWNLWWERIAVQIFYKPEISHVLHWATKIRGFHEEVHSEKWSLISISTLFRWISCNFSDRNLLDLKSRVPISMFSNKYISFLALLYGFSLWAPIISHFLFVESRDLNFHLFAVLLINIR